MKLSILAKSVVALVVLAFASLGAAQVGPFASTPQTGFFGQHMQFITQGGNAFTTTFVQQITGTVEYWTPGTPGTKLPFSPGAVTNYTGGNSAHGIAFTIATPYIVEKVTVFGATYTSRLYRYNNDAGDLVLVEPIRTYNQGASVQFGYNSGAGTIAVFDVNGNLAGLSHSSTVNLPACGEYTWYHTTAYLTTVNGSDPAVLAYRQTHVMGVPYYTPAN